MQKKITQMLLVLLASATLLAASPGFEKLARLKVWNRTDENVYIKLTTPEEQGNLVYFLTAKPAKEVQVFSVARADYDVVITYCNRSARSVADIYTQLPLTFTACNRQPFSAGLR